MWTFLDHAVTTVWHLGRQTPPSLILLWLVTGIVGWASLFYLFLFIAAPIPRAPLPSEKRYTTVSADAEVGAPQQLPCWQDGWKARRAAAQRTGHAWDTSAGMDEAEVFLSVVVPAYNEEARLETMLEEAVEYLDGQHMESIQEPKPAVALNGRAKKGPTNGSVVSHPSHSAQTWEILVISDGSTDRTTDVALRFARAYQRGQNASQGPRTRSTPQKAPRGALRIVSLVSNRGKGGAVTHGMRHVRGRYVLFADADGASKFSDVGKLMRECQAVVDEHGCAVAVGSRAHLVGSEAVVKRSFLRNLLMHSFHLFLRLLTPPATAAIQDTQCGFKLFSRPTLPHIIPYMHSEGWIFDVEMLMLAEAAGIPVVEVAVGWKEVMGSKLNVVWDSLGMAWGLAILRAAWALGIYRRT